MAHWAKIVLVTGFIFIILAFVFWRQLNQFLFHPQGLSLAASQFCLTNLSDHNVVARLSVTGGENSTSFVGKGETVCSASPQEGRPSMAKIGVGESAPSFCEKSATAGKTVVLKVFIPPSKCEWDN